MIDMSRIQSFHAGREARSGKHLLRMAALVQHGVGQVGRSDRRRQSGLIDDLLLHVEDPVRSVHLPARRHVLLFGILQLRHRGSSQRFIRRVADPMRAIIRAGRSLRCPARLHAAHICRKALQAADLSQPSQVREVSSFAFLRAGYARGGFAWIDAFTDLFPRRSGNYRAQVLGQLVGRLLRGDRRHGSRDWLALDDPGGRAPLLHHVRQFMGQQTSSLGSAGIISTVTEDHMVRRAVGPRVKHLRRARRQRIVVDTHRTEVVPKSRLEVLAHITLQRPSRRLQRLVDRRWHHCGLKPLPACRGTRSGTQPGNRPHRPDCARKLTPTRYPLRHLLMTIVGAADS